VNWASEHTSGSALEVEIRTRECAYVGQHERLALIALSLAEVPTPISVSTSGYPLHMVDGLLLEILRNLTVVFAHMLCVPTIAASLILTVRTQRKGCRGTFQCNITCTHDRLSDVLEAVVYMPRLLYGIDLGERAVERDRHRVVSIENRIQTVQLMCHRRGEHGVVDIVVDWLRKIVVPCRILYFNVTQSFC
jgi:hypothetical protein